MFNPYSARNDFSRQNLTSDGHKLNYCMSNVNPLQVVGRASDTQLKVGENLNKMTWGVKG